MSKKKKSNSGWLKGAASYPAFVVDNVKATCVTPKCGNLRARDQRRCKSCVVVHRLYGDAQATRLATAEFKSWREIGESFVTRQICFGGSSTIAVLDYFDEIIARAKANVERVERDYTPYTSLADVALGHIVKTGCKPEELAAAVAGVVFLSVSERANWTKIVLAGQIGRFMSNTHVSMGDRNRSTRYTRALGLQTFEDLKPWIVALRVHCAGQLKDNEERKRRFGQPPVSSTDGSI